LTFAAKKKLTPELQALKNKLKAERIKKSNAADKLIRHSTIDEFKSNVLTDTENLWVVFFGSKKCPHTQRFNPKWLQFQENMDNGLYNLDNVKITKIECYGDQFDFCMSQNNQYWPELMFYYKGVKKAVYNGEDEIEDIVKYLKSKKSTLMKESIKTTKAVKQVNNRITTKQPPSQIKSRPTKKPTKQPATRLTKSPPPTYKQINSEKVQTLRPKAPPAVTSKKPITKNVVENDNIDDNMETDNDVNNAIEEDDIVNLEDVDNDNNDNIKDADFIDDELEKESSHTFAYSIGGCAGFVACFLFFKKRFRGHGYTRVSDARNPQMKYKYDKHIV